MVHLPLLLQTCHDTARQETFAFTSFQFPNNVDGILIDAPAFRPGIVVGTTPLESNSVPAAKLLPIIQVTKGYRVEAEPFPVNIDPGAANGFSVPFADLRRGLDNHNGFRNA